MDRSKRAFELDALRGLALFLMILHHMIFDFRYLLGLNIFAFQETYWFNDIVRPVFVGVFVVVSGICCQFSRNNLKRSLKLCLIALGFSAVMAAFSLVSGDELYVFFNVLHLLALGTFLYGLYAIWEERNAKKRRKSDPDASLTSLRGEIAILVLSAVIIFSDQLINIYSSSVQSYWLLPLGFLPQYHIGMGDYLPILPWLGFFFVGVIIGRLGYRSKQTLFPDSPKSVLRVSRPFEWFGRNSLLIYLVHQPILLAILFGLRYLGVW
jgi:uncharacterized membrane protein